MEFRAAYDDYEIQHTGRNEILLPASTGDNGQGPLLWKVSRDREQENRWQDELLQTGMESTGTFNTYTPKSDALDWVAEKLPNLAEEGFEVYGAKDLKAIRPAQKR